LSDNGGTDSDIAPGRIVPFENPKNESDLDWSASLSQVAKGERNFPII